MDGITRKLKVQTQHNVQNNTIDQVYYVLVMGSWDDIPNPRRVHISYQPIDIIDLDPYVGQVDKCPLVVFLSDRERCSSVEGFGGYQSSCHMGTSPLLGHKLIAWEP